MSAKIFLEGGSTGPHSKALNSECRKGFRELIEKAGLKGRAPALVACGSRASAYRDFKTAVRNSAKTDLVALWVDSEDPMADIEKTWEHLKQRPGDNWTQPTGTSNEQVFLMTTCMETLYVADRKALRTHFGTALRETALPPEGELETRDRHKVQKSLAAATQDCANIYGKGRHSYELLGKLNSDTLAEVLPSFRRTLRILNARL